MEIKLLLFGSLIFRGLCFMEYMREVNKNTEILNDDYVRNFCCGFGIDKVLGFLERY